VIEVAAMKINDALEMKVKPDLDPDFVPASLWNQTYRDLTSQDPDRMPLSIALRRPDNTVSVYETEILPHEKGNVPLNIQYVERLVKSLLWQKGGSRIIIGGNDEIAETIKGIYSPEGERSFDYHFMGERIFGEPLVVESCALDAMPNPEVRVLSLDHNLGGCRIGIDLGGSDRKCVALLDGRVVYSEAVPWNPYFQKDPTYHMDHIRGALRRAAEKLPRVDSIGVSAAGIYVDNEVRAASLFRGVSQEDFNRYVRGIFHTMEEEWNVPVTVANDGDVAALASSLDLNGVLGISMGTSMAAGYVDTYRNLTHDLNELAFAPIDYRTDAPVDEWSGDAGCGVQYFSQQGVARLIEKVGISFPDDMPLPEKLLEVQNRIKEDDNCAQRIFHTIGAYLGYAIAHYADFYEIRNVVIMGRVTSGNGGKLMAAKAEEVLEKEFSGLAGTIRIVLPDENRRQFCQAIAAAGLPKIKRGI
jgi:predicted NBD/HSP70 family sugar kinase